MNLIEALKQRGKRDIEVKYDSTGTYRIAADIDYENLVKYYMPYMPAGAFYSNHWVIVKEKKVKVFENIKWQRHNCSNWDGKSPNVTSCSIVFPVMQTHDFFESIENRPNMKMTFEWTEE